MGEDGGCTGGQSCAGEGNKNLLYEHGIGRMREHPRVQPSSLLAFSPPVEVISGEYVALSLLGDLGVFDLGGLGRVHGAGAPEGRMSRQHPCRLIMRCSSRLGEVGPY